MTAATQMQLAYDTASRAVERHDAWARTHTRPEHGATSYEAARKAKSNVQRDVDELCALLAHHPEGLTREQIGERLGKRCSDALRLGRVHVAGVRLNSRGNKSRVWKLGEGVQS